jgi:hypothetical protein
MTQFGLIILICFFLLVLFLPFVVSLWGARTFAIMAFICCCAATYIDITSVDFASGPPNPSRDTKNEIMFWSCWLPAWIFSVIGVWLKHRKKARLLRPVKELYRRVVRERLHGKDYAYFDGQDRNDRA